METMGFIFGMGGIIFGIFGFLAYLRITALEKKLKDTGVLDKDFNSENSI